MKKCILIGLFMLTGCVPSREDSKKYEQLEQWDGAYLVGNIINETVTADTNTNGSHK